MFGNGVPIEILILVNVGLIWALMAAPVGKRTVVVSKVIAVSRQRLWSALYLFGENAGWDGTLVSVKPTGERTADVEIAFSGRDGQPIRRSVKLANVDPERSCETRTVYDSSLDETFWVNHHERFLIEDAPGGCRVTVAETDHYRGLAFLLFRLFKNRRHIAALDKWAVTGEYSKVGIFEKLPMQLAMGALSVLVFWPFFGLTEAGFILSLVLTMVVAMHEIGHMFAFRAMGHKSARMIFLPLLGGVAIGGRPYDSHFEVGFSALMGAGFSAFPVVISVALYHVALNTGHDEVATWMGAFGLIGSLFNLGNLVPVWKFDGGQVIRQIFSSRVGQGLASFILLAGMLSVGHAGGFDSRELLVVGAVFAILSLMTTGSGIKPRYALHPMSDRERVLIFSGLLATFVAHAACAIWAFTFFM